MNVGPFRTPPPPPTKPEMAGSQHQCARMTALCARMTRFFLCADDSFAMCADDSLSMCADDALTIKKWVIPGSARPALGRKFRKIKITLRRWWSISFWDAEATNCWSCEVHQRSSKWWLSCEWHDMKSVHNWLNELNSWTNGSMNQWRNEAMNQWVTR